MTKQPTVAITGASGQLGLHATLWFKHHYSFNVLAVGREHFSDLSLMKEMLASADTVLHLAGMNRGSDEEVGATNVALAEGLVEALGPRLKDVHLLYASSVQIERDNAYGRAKLKAGNLLEAACAKAGGRYSNIVLPNLFGEFSKPDYNNFTGTFCARLCAGEELPINDPESPVELMHYGEAACLFHECIATGHTGMLRPSGVKTTVGQVADKLTGFHTEYSGGIVPDVRDVFDLRLFNSLRSVMFKTQFPAKLVRHADDRGSFFECVRAQNHGQTSFSTTVPGIVRGNHFHFDKVERFLVLSGSARISVRSLADNQTFHFDVDGENPVYVDMPTIHTHNIRNTGSDELLTLFWINDFFDPQNPDTYPEEV